MPATAYFMLRVRRGAPQVPGKLSWCHHEPGCEENVLDRGRLSPYPRAEVAGREVPPEFLLDRIGVRWRGDTVPQPHVIIAALADTARLQPRPHDHWASLTPISRGEYEYRLAHLEWSREWRPSDPRNFTNKPIKPAELPIDFSWERELVG
jgi:hypothetical protein